MSNFVLVHGGCHGSWCWDRVADALRAAGHMVEAVDLPGRDGVPAGAMTTLDDYVAVVAGAVERAAAPVTLVAHSMGGVTASQFAELHAEKIGAVIFVNALVPCDGEAGMPKMQAGATGSPVLEPGAMEVTPDGSAVSLAADCVTVFYNRCRREDVDWAVARLCPEPLLPLMTPVALTAEGFGSVRKVYVGAREDRVLPWHFQQQMASDSGTRMVELAGDHSPFLSVPDELVKVLCTEAA